MSIKRFPYLNSEEFAEACHYLDLQYCRANLGVERRRWQLQVNQALNADFFFDAGCTTFVQITRPLQTDIDFEQLSSNLDGFSISEDTGDGNATSGDKDMIDAEMSDEGIIPKQPSRQDIGMVEYEIHLHPVYKVPCLWFTLRGLPPDEPVFNIDTVFRRLVPDEYKTGLRGLGGVGGISADHNPVTGLPSFFVHPCLVGDAMSKFACSRQNYLMVWLGLVGGCMGLWAPKEMAL